MDVGAKTDRGLKRVKNEDSFLVKAGDCIFAVADGVGGNNSGEVASTFAADEISKYIDSFALPPSGDTEALKEFFGKCIVDVNSRVLNLSSSNEDYSGMATTLVMLYIDRYSRKAYFLNIGDSRAYILRGKTFKQITEDHTYVNSLVKAGLISKEEAEHHENKNMITKAIGAEYRIEPDFFITEIVPGDVILLCTDGLYGEVSENEIVEELKSGGTMETVCESLVEKALNHGGNDNITVITVKVTEEDFR